MSLSVSDLSKSYYNLYALTQSDTYKSHALDASAVSKSQYNVADVSAAFDMLSSGTNYSTIGSISGYAKNLFKLSQIKNTGTADTLQNSVISLLAGDTDMYSLLDTSAANSEKVKQAVSSSNYNNAVSAYEKTLTAYQQYLADNDQSLISMLI